MTHILVVAGPTASGKSALALALAQAFGGTVINADSMQVYAGLETLTSQPGPEARTSVPHRLYGILDAADPCSAARWRDRAATEIAMTEEAGRLPIVVGGTGLYLKALMRGIVPMPPISPDSRLAARKLHGELGGEAFRAELARHDPESAALLHAGDRQRLIRAYEVVTATGTPLPEWQRRTVDGDARRQSVGMRTLTIVLAPPRAELRDGIVKRLEAMVGARALDEVRALTARRLSPEFPAMKALGVREFARHLSGELVLEQAIRAAAVATGQYAKRQATWFRHQMIADYELNEKFSKSNYPKIHSLVSKFLLTEKD